MDDLLQNNPLVRLALPLMAGVVFSSLCSISDYLWLLLLLLFFVVATLSMFFERLSILFGVSAMAAMFSIGGFVWQKDAEDMQPRWSEAKGQFSACFLETPRMGDRTTKALAMVVREDGDTLGGRLSGVCYLYLANCVETENLSIGDRITFTTKVKNPRNAGNPAEFDYEQYLYIKGVTGTVYLPVYSWKSEGRVVPTLRMRALSFREKIVRMYEHHEFGKDAKSVLSALTIGDKSELTREIKETYSSVGASHVLALSGLHIGVFYMILSTLLPVWRNRRVYTILREILIIAFIWCFAFVAGLSPSIVRAAILFTIFSIGKCVRRDDSSLNALAFAAIAIIIFSPRSLYDVSFQLSFAAVLSIILLLPSIRQFLACDKHGRLYNYVVDIISVSLVAQIGTLPFIWYYFGAFPLYFLLANIIVVPISFLIMSFAVLLWVTDKIAYISSGVAYLLENITDAMNSLLRIIEALPYSKITLPYIDVLAAWGLALTTIFALLLIAARRRSTLLMFTLMLFLTTGRILHLHADEHENYMLFYNSSKYTAVQFVVSREKSYILSDVERDEADLDYVVTPYLRRAAMNEPLWVYGNYKDENIISQNGVVEFRGRRMKILCDKSWQDDTLTIPVDILFLCKGFKGRMKDVLDKYPARKVIMDAGLHAMSRRRVARECENLGACCIDISQEGALQLFCDDEQMQPYYMGQK